MSPSAEALLRQNQTALANLQRRRQLIAGGYIIALLSTALCLYAIQPGYSAAGWLLAALCFAARPLWLLQRHLTANHRPDEPRLLPNLGYANTITLGRGWLIAGLGGLLLVPRLTGAWAWLPAGLYGTIVVLDVADGYVARRTNHVTRLGAILDIGLDGWGLLAAIAVAVRYGQLPLWYLPLAFSREAFLAGQWRLHRLGRPVYALTPSTERRIIAGLQMGFLCIVLMPAVRPPMTTIAAALFGTQLLASFVRDWLAVSGAVDPAGADYMRWQRAGRRVFKSWLPLIARLSSAGATLLLLKELLPHVAHQPSLWAACAWGAMAMLLTLAGIWTRLGAGALLILTLWHQQAFGFAWLPDGLLAISAILIIQLGSGPWTLRADDDSMWYRPG
ncbi:MAG: CDP-alcohol phosphatidyltransferase family protein [Caldilineaceae bacterium]|nr:CDP-alcohol phosphatidyltransferase family protein [Caldilineaceae bacterium]